MPNDLRSLPKPTLDAFASIRSNGTPFVNPLAEMLNSLQARTKSVSEIVYNNETDPGAVTSFFTTILESLNVLKIHTDVVSGVKSVSHSTDQYGLESRMSILTSVVNICFSKLDPTDSDTVESKVNEIFGVLNTQNETLVTLDLALRRIEQTSGDMDSLQDVLKNEMPFIAQVPSKIQALIEKDKAGVAEEITRVKHLSMATLLNSVKNDPTVAPVLNMVLNSDMKNILGIK